MLPHRPILFNAGYALFTTRIAASSKKVSACHPYRILTRGHLHDPVTTRSAATTPNDQIGVIGSATALRRHARRMLLKIDKGYATVRTMRYTERKT
jgi:hypothetical protein